MSKLKIGKPAKRKGSPRPHLRIVGKPYLWKPGQSGNPAGRSKRVRISEALAEGLARPAELNGKETGQTVAEAIADKTLTRALNEDGLAATEMILDRTEGKPTQSMELAGPGGQEITLRIVHGPSAPSGTNSEPGSVS